MQAGGALKALIVVFKEGHWGLGLCRITGSCLGRDPKVDDAVVILGLGESSVGSESSWEEGVCLELIISLGQSSGPAQPELGLNLCSPWRIPNYGVPVGSVG